MVRTSLFLLIFGLLCLAPAIGQDSAEPPPAEPSADGQPPEQPPEELQLPPLVVAEKEILAELDQSETRIRALTEKAGAAEGADLRILGRQIVEGKLDYLDTVNKLVKNLLAQETEGLPTGELRKRVEADLQSLPEAFVENIEATDEEIVKIRKQRDEAEPADRLSFEHSVSRRVDWLDALYKSYTELLRQMELVGLDASESRVDLTERTTIRADRLAGRLVLVAERMKVVQQRLADAPDDATLKSEIQVLEEQRTTLSRAMSDTAGILDRLGLDSSTYRKTLIKSTGEVTTDVFRGGVFKALVGDWIDESQDWFRTNGRVLAFRLIVFCLILVASRIIAGITKRLLARGSRRSRTKKSALLQKMMQGLAVRVIMILGFLFGLNQLGFELGPLLAGLGIAGFIVGFALQDSLSNFASGVMILGYRPFDMGDMIEAGGVFGRVHDMSLVSTTILTIDNQTLIVPNSKIWGDVIKNVTNQTRRRIDLKFLIAHAEDVERIEGLFKGILQEHPKVLDDPEPMVKLHALGEYAMEFVVRPWVETADYWEVRWDIVRAVKRMFDTEGITIPVPSRDVRLTQN